MGRRRHLIGAGALGALVLLAGCGGDDETTQPTQPTTTITDSGHMARVINGDTADPILDATVAPVTGSTTGTPIAPGEAGLWPLPADATGVYVRYPPFGAQRYAAVPKDKPGQTVIVRLYDPKLQSAQYGDGPSRTRFNPDVMLKPPSGRPAWSKGGRALLEFPPVVYNGVAVITNNPGRVFAYDVLNGRQLWTTRHTKPGQFIAASPAIDPSGPAVIVAGMDGIVNAYALRGGKATVWKRPFSTGGSPIETSPLLVDGSVYVGTWSGTLYKLNAQTGRMQCSFRASADIKGSAAQHGENVIFADYAGNVYAMRRRDCKPVWRVNAGAKFYGGPGVSGDTVVLGDVGGAVVALNATDGSRRWRVGTGNMVYSSPAIARGTVFIGSYDRRLRALRLSDGRELWSFDTGGRISGSASVIGNTVYVSVLAARGEKDRTYGLNVRTGRRVWTKDDGRYSPAVGAGRTIFITGRTSLYAYPAP